MYAMAPYRGLGDAAQGVQLASGLGTPLLGGALAAHAASTAAATGSAVSILGMAPALALPIIGAAITGVTIALTYLIRNSGCGPSCVATSGWANQAEPLLKQNIDAYFALPAPRTQSQQNAALNNFDVTWERLKQLCGQQGTGNAGVRCISDRQSGACTWRQRADSPLLKYPNQPQPGECWNWFSGYRDPIANDPNVVPDTALSLASLTIDTAAGSLGVSPMLLMLALGLVAAAVIL